MRLRVSLLGLLAVVCLLAQDSAWELYARGRDAEKAGHMAEAYLLYSQAAAMEPRNKSYWQRAQSVQSRAAMQAKPQPQIPAVHDLDKELNEPTEPYFDLPSAEDLAAGNELLPPTELDADHAIRDIDFTGDYKALFKDVTHAYGLDCVYDSDYQVGTPFRFRLQSVDYRDALHALEAATGSFLVKVTPKLLMVAHDTPQKRTEIEPTVTITVHLPETFTQQDFNEIVRDVQQTMAIEKVGLDPSTFSLVMRDRISKVVYARALLEELVHARAQVGLEMRFIEITRNDSITYGINFPTMFSLNFLGSILNNQLQSLQSGLSGVLAFGGGKSLIGIGIASVGLVGQMTHSASKILLDSQLRTMSGQKATLHIGQKYPILSGSYGTATSATGVGSITPAPSFTFQDLGLTLNTTPVVHDVNSVSLDIEAQFQVLTGASINGLPVISNRSVKNVTRLKFGEWAVVAGLMTLDEARTISGLAGLSSIPFLSPLTSTHVHNNDNDQVILLLKPVLLTLPPNDSVQHVFRTGSENRPLTPL